MSRSDTTYDAAVGEETSAVPQVLLRVLATTDLHAQILPWDDLSDRPAPDRGLAAVASLIATARDEVAGSLLLDNGDFLNGSPLADHIAERAGRSGPHPMIAAMNHIGYDAATLGNHEFSNGIPLLRRALAQARFPVVATNLDRVSPDGHRRPFLPRHVLLQRDLTDQHGTSHRLTIGILGFLPPQTTLWERRHLSQSHAARDILEAARHAVPRLRRAGADVVIALSHSGLGQDLPGGPPAENVSCALSDLPGIDVVIAGHTHQLYPAPERADHRRAMVMPGFFGSHLGVIDLSLGRTGTGWTTVGHKAHLRPVARRAGPDGELTPLAPAAPAIAEMVKADVTAMRAQAARPIGVSAVALHSYFALIGFSAVQTLLAEAQRHNMARALRATPEAALPLVVAGAPFKSGGRGGPSNYTAIPAGPLTTRNITDLYIHPNSPVALRVTGDQLALWLERSVSLFRQIRPGAQDQTLIDPDFPAYNFDMIHGLSYRVDLTRPARFDSSGKLVDPQARRITDLCHNGQPLRADAEFVLVTNSYRASGGAGFAGTGPSQVVMEESRPLRRILQDFIAEAGQIAPALRADWRFVSLPGTSVCFDSAPEAAAHATEVPGLQPLGPMPTGFLRFRLPL